MCLSQTKPGILMADGQSQRLYTLPYGAWTAGDSLVQSASTYMAASPQSHAP